MNEAPKEIVITSEEELLALFGVPRVGDDFAAIAAHDFLKTPQPIDDEEV